MVEDLNPKVEAKGLSPFTYNLITPRVSSNLVTLSYF
jgi:hypothetical protein